MNNKVLIGIVIVIIVFGGGYLAAKSMKPAAPAQDQTAQPTTAADASPTAAAMTETNEAVTVSGSEFAFTPATFMAKKGTPMTVTFKNTGKYPHNFTIAELNVKSDTIQPGEKTTVTFTPDKTGSFTYICTVPSHADRGMKGILIVQ